MGPDCAVLCWRAPCLAGWLGGLRLLLMARASALCALLAFSANTEPCYARIEAGRPDTAVTDPPPGFPPSLRPGCLKPDGQPNIFCPGDDGYGCYKIPTMLHHSSGVLLALVEARKYSCDDHGYVDLRLRRSSDSGRSWGPSLLVHGNSTEDHWTTVGDANVVEDARTGVVWMVHTRNNSRLFLSHSTTVGLSWSPPRDVTAELRRGSSGGGTGHAGGIQLSGHGPYAGRLLIPVYSSAGSYTVYSDTRGMSWRAGAAVPQPKGEAGADEWAIAESGAFTSDGTPILLGSRRNVPPGDVPSGVSGRGYRLQTLSTDGGISWAEEWEQKQLPEPIQGCEGALVWHPGSRKLYFSHPDPPLDLLRTQLRVWSSANMGATWESHAVVWAGAAGYSSLVVIGNSSSPQAPLGVYYDRNNHTMAIFEAQSVSFTTIPP